MFNISHGLANRVPLTKLVELDRDILQYFVMLIVTMLAWADEALVVPKGI